VLGTPAPHTAVLCRGRYNSPRSQWRITIKYLENKLTGPGFEFARPLYHTCLRTAQASHDRRLDSWELHHPSPEARIGRLTVRWSVFLLYWNDWARRHADADASKKEVLQCCASYGNRHRLYVTRGDHEESTHHTQLSLTERSQLPAVPGQVASARSCYPPGPSAYP
jgi:hypothetical protein